MNHCRECNAIIEKQHDYIMRLRTMALKTTTIPDSIILSKAEYAKLHYDLLSLREELAYRRFESLSYPHKILWVFRGGVAEKWEMN